LFRAPLHRILGENFEGATSDMVVLSQ